MDELKIEKNIPLPLKKRPTGDNTTNKLRDLLLRMDIGDSVLIPDKKHFNAFGNAKKHDTEMQKRKYKCFKEGVTEIRRIFRIK